jgi:bacterial/archaeal transporter family protein
MALPVWFVPTMVVLVSWGIVGIFQKLCTNYVSAESALIWWLAGFTVLMPWLYPGPELFRYPARSVEWALASGMLNAVGALALLAAMKNGGKASIVAPFAALYPLLVALVAPFIFHESITLLQGGGIASALIAVVLLST